MVQVTTGLPQRDIGGQIGSAFGNAFGQGVQKGMGSQFEQALHMQRQQQASDLQSQRQQQLAQQQQQQAAQEQSKLQQALAQYEQQNPNMDPLMKQQLGVYKALAGHPEIAKQLASGQQKLSQQEQDRKFIEQLTNRQGQPNQEVPQTPQQPMNNVETPQTNLTQKKGAPFTNDQILATSLKYPTVARDMRAQNDAWEKRNIEENKANRKERMEFHKESKDYDQELLHQTKTAKNQVETLKEIDKAIKSGNVKPTSMANVFKGMGTIGEKISQAVLNKDESTLLSSIPQLLEGWKDVFGIRLSDADLALLQDKLPSIGKSQEANQAVIRILRKYADMTLLRSKIASEIKEDNGGMRPLGYGDMIEKRVDEMTQNVKIINPNNGQIIDIPAYKLSDALQSGAKLANE